MRRALALSLLSLLVTAAPAWAQEADPEPDPDPPPTIADGVTVAGIDVGGLTAEEATALVQAAFDAPVALKLRKRTWTATPLQVGARADVPAAVAAALAAAPAQAVGLPVRFADAVLKRYVSALQRRLSRPAKDSKLRFRGVRPFVTKARKGLRVRPRATRKLIKGELRAHERGPLALAVRVLRPRTTRRNFGPVVVIRRESRRLHLYRGMRPWTSFPVAVGQPSYPTPIGRFRIVSKQRNPWWYPPRADWAAGASPIPPGPNNPLGTRWMGLSVGAVGIHGTPASGSIGSAASHGCVRMHIGSAEWLFERVRIGTTVFIVRA